MTLPLPADVLFTFALTEGDTATVSVVDGGPVEYSDSLAGPFGEVAGAIAADAAEDFTRAVTLRADVDSTIDIAYASAVEPEPPPESEPK